MKEMCSTRKCLFFMTIGALCVGIVCGRAVGKTYGLDQVESEPERLIQGAFGGDGTSLIRINELMLSTLEVGDWIDLGEVEGLIQSGFVDWSDARSVGGVIGNDEGSFMFIVRDEIVSGYLRIGGVGVYEISGERGRALTVTLRGEGTYPACAGGEIVVNQGVDEGMKVGDTSELLQHPSGDAVDVIDVLVAYTTEAKNDVGGTAQMEARIDLAIAASNRAYVNSLIPFEIRLVHSYEVDYNENTGAYGDHLRALTFTDGMMDEIHELRDTYGADMVSLLVDDGRSCGNAWTMRTNSTSFAGSAFSVVTWSCAVGNMSFAHELGHNMGACHAVGDPCSGGTYSYSNGHRFVGDSGASWRSVMAYAPGSRVEYFSNPDVEFDGAATGVLNVSQNGLTLSRTGPTVAQFRATASDCRADFSGEGDLNFFDISLFVSFFIGEAEQADFTDDGIWNFFDVSAFMLAFAAGCP